jgi:hypothetical protein
MSTTARHELSPDLSGHHKHTFDAVFRHPTPHNLAWHDVHSLLKAMAEVTEEHNGNLKVSRNGQFLTLHSSGHNDVASVEDVISIRKFLEASGNAILTPPVPSGAQLLVVIDHHEAKIYSTEAEGSTPQKLSPFDPHGHGRHLHSESPETAGKRAPERKSFYEAVAKTLRGSEEILVFGTGHGESSAMLHLMTDLKAHHHDVFEKVVGTVNIDEKHTTEGELLAKAREFFASR